MLNVYFVVVEALYNADHFVNELLSALELDYLIKEQESGNLLQVDKVHILSREQDVISFVRPRIP